MRIQPIIRVSLVALLYVFAAGFSSSAEAQSTGSVRIDLVKAGWFVGGSGGSGTLTYRGRSYPLSVGGLSAGLTFGASVTKLTGTARNLRAASDIVGGYTAIGSGAAVVGGVRVTQLRNARGVVLNLSGPSVGLSFDIAYLSGMSIQLR